MDAIRCCLAGMAGLEPADEGVKVPCLTTWRHPCVEKRKQGLGSLPIPVLRVGWVMGLEPTTPGTTIRCYYQLSYTHHMARQKGFEPLTYCLEGSCSILLSYWRILWSG